MMAGGNRADYTQIHAKRAVTVNSNGNAAIYMRDRIPIRQTFPAFIENKRLTSFVLLVFGDDRIVRIDEFAGLTLSKNVLRQTLDQNAADYPVLPNLWMAQLLNIPLFRRRKIFFRISDLASRGA